jgi:hypothetical protein
MSPLAFWGSAKRGKRYYTDLMDDRKLTLWNNGFLAMAYMHTHLVLPTKDDFAGLHEMQTFIYDVLEENLKTD